MGRKLRDHFAVIAIMDFEQNTDPSVLPDLMVNDDCDNAVRHDVETSGYLDVQHLAR